MTHPKSSQVPLKFYIGPYKIEKYFELIRYKYPFWQDKTITSKKYSDYPINSFISSALLNAEEKPVHMQGLTYIAAQYPRYLTDLTTDFESYQSSLGQKLRYSTRRASKKFFEQSNNNPTFKAFKTVDEISEFYTLARVVASKTYQEKQLGLSIPDDPEYLEKLKTKAKDDSARGYMLFMHNKPIAFALALADEGMLVGEYMGFDPEFGKLSPGVVVKWESLKNLFDEQIFKWFDFTEGEGLHKRRFATHTFNCCNIFIVENTLKNRTLFASHRLFTNLADSIDATLDNVGLKRKIKKILRR